MIYYIYLRTAYIPYQKVKKEFRSIEEVNLYLDTVEDFTDYLVIGYGKDVPPYTSMGKIDRPLVKTLSKINKNRKR